MLIPRIKKLQLREDASPNSNSLLESPPGKVYSPREHSIAKFEERHEQHRLLDRQASRQLMPFPMIQGRTLLTNQQFAHQLTTSCYQMLDEMEKAIASHLKVMKRRPGNAPILLINGRTHNEIAYIDSSFRRWIQSTLISTAITHI